MTALLIILAAIVLLFIGYVFYGSWLAKQWGIDPKKTTPAKSMPDGVDYVEAKPAVLMGHHFSSIAGAGPINGPILAAAFGWVPVFLWCVIGGIFFGGVQDFGSLFASIRHDGKSVGEIIKSSMGKTAKKLFIVFALLVLILVIASFVNVVAATFLTKYRAVAKVTVEQTEKATFDKEQFDSLLSKNGLKVGTKLDGSDLFIEVSEDSEGVAKDKMNKVIDFVKKNGLTYVQSDATGEAVSPAVEIVSETSLDGSFISSVNGHKNKNNQTTAMISVLFIILAVFYGILTNKCGLKTLPATIIGIAGIVGIVIFGLNYGIVMGRTGWVIFVAVYIAIASLIPVWIMLQPRDYLSSFLLYAMILVALVGIVMSAFVGNVQFTIPAFNGWKVNGNFIFPTLFITVACGACSGFHSLIASGTTSKQLDSEKNAKAIGYGSMLIESALGVISLIAVGVVWAKWTGGELGKSPAAAFGAGIATMFGKPGSAVYDTISALLTLAVSVFALTSLDSATRLSRFMFAELFLKEGEKDWKDASGIRKLLANPLFGTALMVAIGSTLGFLELSAIWSLFGAANQLLAGIALLAVAAWLGEVGKNNKMFIIPMIFMLAATLTSLVLTVIAKVKDMVIGSANAFVWGNWFQMIFAFAMAVLAVVLVIEGVKTFVKQAKAK